MSHKTNTTINNVENKTINPQPYVCPVPSAEQQEAIRSLRIDNKNIVVKGIPGAGKTTLILEIAKAFPRTSILALTFSASLKDEMRFKKEELGLNNLVVHSYHSFVKNHYDQPDAHTDIGLITLIRQDVKPHTLCPFKMVLLDEEQDKTFTLHQLTLKIIRDHFLCPIQRQIQKQHRQKDDQDLKQDPKQVDTIVSSISFDQQLIMCVLGDPHQNIYAYKGSDSRYLTMAPSLLGHLSTRQWSFITLQTSFRLTKPMAQFINHHVFHGQPKLVALKDGPPVEYYRCCAWNSAMDIVHSLLWKDRIHPNDIFVFSPSTGPRTLSSRINNFLAAHGNFTFISNEESPPDSSRLMSNKTSFLTHWKGKGLERKVSIVLHFDTSALRWDPEETQCPPALFVALTRGSERLIVIHDHRYPHLPFMDMDHVTVQDWEEAADSLNCTCPSTRCVSSSSFSDESDGVEHKVQQDETMDDNEHETISVLDQEQKQTDNRETIGTNPRKRKRTVQTDQTDGDNTNDDPRADRKDQKEHTKPTTKPDITYTVPQLLRHRQVMELMHLVRYIDVVLSSCESTNKTTKASDWDSMSITIPSLVCSGQQTVEDVRALNEIAIPAIFEMATTTQCSILSNLFRAYKDSTLDQRLAHDDRLRTLFRTLQKHKHSQQPNTKQHVDSVPQPLNVSDILFLSCVWNAHVSGHHHRFMQLKNFDWIHKEDTDIICRLIKPHLPSTEGLLFNQPLSVCVEVCGAPTGTSSSSTPGKKICIELNGTLDAVDVTNKTVFQFLWNSEITLEHQVRMECTMWMMKHALSSSTPRTQETMVNLVHPWNSYRYKIVNILDGKVCELSIRKDVNEKEFDSLIHELVSMKLAKRSTLTDAEFLQQCSISF